MLAKTQKDNNTTRMALRSLEKAMAQTKEIEMPELSSQRIKEKSGVDMLKIYIT